MVREENLIGVLLKFILVYFNGQVLYMPHVCLKRMMADVGFGVLYMCVCLLIEMFVCLINF